MNHKRKLLRSAKTFAKTILPEGTSGRRIATTLYGRLRSRQVAAGHATYADWIRDFEPTTWAPLAVRGYRPLISLVVPTFNTPQKYLLPMVESVLGQSYEHWELLIVQGSTDANCAAAIAEQAVRDPRIKLVSAGDDRGIAANTNAGIVAAQGEFIGFLDHDDTLAPNALNEIVVRLQADSSLDWFYSDEDKLSEDGTQRLPFFFKPGWSPALLFSVNYVTHFCVVRADLIRKLGGIRLGFDGAQDYDFALRLSELTDRIAHIPKVLYHWRLAIGSTAIAPGQKSEADTAGQRALRDYVARNHIAATVVGVDGAPTNYRLRYQVPAETVASLIIPFKDKSDVTRVMVDSILRLTTGVDYEIILVDNRSDEVATAEYLASLTDPRIKVVAYDAPFNWSAVNNFGRQNAKGNVLVFLNNDMEVVTADWLAELCGVAVQPRNGAVGALLRYPDGSIQHAGVSVGLFGVAGHVFRRLDTGNFTLFGLADWPRNYLAVTGACIAVEALKFDTAGGFDEAFQTAGSDVAFGIRLHESGLSNVYWPFARLTHYENVSVGVYDERTDTQNDYDESMKYYAPYLKGHDPFFNPNFELYDEASETILLRRPQ